MSLLRLIIWGLIFYIVSKVIRNVMQVLKNDDTRESVNPPKRNVNSKINIDKKDIIEAQFEELKSNNESK